jgi:hypothetical protein
MTQVKPSYAPAQGSVSCLRSACVLVVPVVQVVQCDSIRCKRLK